MQDKREKVRLAVVDALAKANPALHPHIVTLSVEKNLSIRSHAADAIARLKSDGRGAFPALAAAAATALNGESTDLASIVSSMAAVAPEHPETLRLVLALCKHQNARDGYGYFSAPIRRTACQLATTIGEVVGPNDRRRLIETVASLLTLTDPRVLVSAIESLAAFGKDAAAAEPAIRSLRTHPDKSVRDAAERALPLLSGEGTRP
jgi:HEAT repeat protein